MWAGFSAISPQQAHEIEQLGYGTIWLGGSPRSLTPARKLLEATSTVRLATGITNIWNTDASQIATEFTQLEADFPGRFLLGVGVSHPEAVQEYRSPYDSLVAYLDVLDDGGVPADRRVIAALGPRMLRLARDRALGSHPYLVPAAHTKYAREILGSDKFLAPEHKVVLTEDAELARSVGRPYVDQPYLHLQNYTNNLKRFGYTDADIADGGTDALIDALVAHGSAEVIREQLDAHLGQGADHVAIQILGDVDIVEELAKLI
ncbi:putative F420-dependent oxidoreductase [Williamsia limnetica]|uniref:Putative F420-dependent oxidoreductase n=1 Tax=Williamsia limnetica TaxID=882452 RepID=A0A318RFB8_WILLI|nr:putative F420-dependent oxidoreductase [Williamsia limnetica]